jgi:hypothetical protein
MFHPIDNKPTLQPKLYPFKCHFISIWFANYYYKQHIKGAVSRFYCASKICANLKNYLRTINQVRSEIRYTIYNPFVICRTSLLCFKKAAACIFPNHVLAVALILNVSLHTAPLNLPADYRNRILHINNLLPMPAHWHDWDVAAFPKAQLECWMIDNS